MKILVTGGAGFIGSNIVIELVNRGNEVIVLDDFSTGDIKNLTSVKDEIKIIKGSVTDLEMLKREFVGVDYVLHQAAVPSVPRSINDPATSNNANVSGTLNVLIAARKNNVKRVVYASSSSVYGDIKGDYKKEEMKPNPLSPYAVTKLTGEYYCKVFYEVYGLETVSLRYFNVFGYNQDPNSQYAAVIPKFINVMLKGKRPIIYGDGLQSRDFTFVENNVSANILACNAKGVAGKLFNIATGKSVTLLDLVNHINSILGTDIKPIFAPPRKGDIKHSLADISQAQNTLRYNVLVDFKEGLKKTIDWYKANLDLVLIKNL